MRKINGRWWSEDNREVYPPSKGGAFWVLDSKPGVVDFVHHRPFHLDLAESLHMFMQPAEVEAVLGQPNRIFGTGDHANWYYYAANGTKVSVRFMGDGLGEADYDPVNGKRYSVATIERELGGRNIYSVLAERATQRSGEWRAQKAAESRVDQSDRFAAMRASARSGRSGFSQAVAVPIPQAGATQPPPPKRIVSAEALAALVPGTARADVLTRLGEPSYKSTIVSGEGASESFTYHRASGETVVVRLLNGKVSEVR